MSIKAKYENKMSTYVRLISVGLTFCLSFPIFSNNSGAANITVEKDFPDGNGENSFKCILISSEKKEYECKNNNIPLDTSGCSSVQTHQAVSFSVEGFLIVYMTI